MSTAATDTHTQPESERMLLSEFSGKYLTFALGEECYGFEILKVQEIIGGGAINITEVPKAPAFLKGVINLRGKIIPVIDLRIKLNFVEKKYDSLTCFIVVNTRFGGQDVAVGVVVDTVLEVLHFDTTTLQLPPDYGVSVDLSVVKALGKIQEKIVVLVDIDRILEEVQTIAI